MIQRCSNPARQCWMRYGGRGIKVHPDWEKFEFFLRDMGVRPVGHSIDRINPDGDYEPSNCRWIPVQKQSQTTRLYLSIGACVICGEHRGNRSGRCHRCNEFFRRNGVERPPVEGGVPKRTLPPKPCSTCSAPSKPLVHGRCKRCAEFFRRTGSERPLSIGNLPTHQVKP